MKICILTPRYPFPENGGDVLRINNIARYLKSKGHELILVSFCENKGPYHPKNIADLYNYVYVSQRSRCASTFFSLLFFLCGKPIQCGYYHSSSYKHLLKNVTNKHNPDLYISHLLRMTPYLESIGVTNKSIVEMTDALSKTYNLSINANGSITKRIIYAIEKRLIKNYEQYVIKRFPKVVLVTSEDIKVLDEHGSRNLVVHTNGVDISKKVPTSYDSNKIVFIGNMRTLQNQDAVLYFTNDIFPLITKANPNAKFYIIGAEPPQRIKSLATSNIIVTGFVADLTPYIANACIAVAPVRIAAGIQNKVLVAMGNNVPVVMTSLISKAIHELKDGENCMIRDDAEDIANACLSLMTDKHLREAIAYNGYNMVKRSYSWASKLDGYEVIPT